MFFSQLSPLVFVVWKSFPLYYFENVQDIFTKFDANVKHHIQCVENNNCNSKYFLSSPLAVKRDIAVTILVRCMHLRAFARICPRHNSYIYVWISKLFGTIAVRVEKCHLKHFYAPGRESI